MVGTASLDGQTERDRERERALLRLPRLPVFRFLLPFPGLTAAARAGAACLQPAASELAASQSASAQRCQLIQKLLQALP